MKTLLIVNPTAGQGKPVTFHQTLEEAFTGAEILETKARGDAERFAQEALEQGIEQIIIAGGDGTINEVANALIGSDISMGILPLGTGNVLARELDLPINHLEAAIEVIKKGQTTRIDLGKANGRCFTLMAGIGFDGEVVRQVAPRLKNTLGASAYVLTGLAALAYYRPARLLIEIDDQRITTSAYLAVVANATSYAYQVKVTPHASMTDGLLDVCLFRERISLGFLKQIAGVLTGRHLQNPHIRYYTGQRIYVESYPPVAVQIDGDYFGETPIEINVIPQSLSIYTNP